MGKLAKYSSRSLLLSWHVVAWKHLICLIISHSQPATSRHLTQRSWLSVDDLGCGLLPLRPSGHARHREGHRSSLRTSHEPTISCDSKRLASYPRENQMKQMVETLWREGPTCSPCGSDFDFLSSIAIPGRIFTAEQWQRAKNKHIVRNLEVLQLHLGSKSVVLTVDVIILNS